MEEKEISAQYTHTHRASSRCPAAIRNRIMYLFVCFIYIDCCEREREIERKKQKTSIFSGILRWTCYMIETAILG